MLNCLMFLYLGVVTQHTPKLVLESSCARLKLLIITLLLAQTWPWHFGFARFGKCCVLTSSRDDQLWSTLTWVWWSRWFLVIYSAKMLIGSLYSNPNKIQTNHMDGGVVKCCLRMVLGHLLCQDVHPPAARNTTRIRFRQGWELIFCYDLSLAILLKLYKFYSF